MTSPTPSAEPDDLASAAGIPAGLVLGIDHVGVATGDLDGTVAFYRDTLGLRESRREHNPDQQVVEVMLVPASATARTAGATDPPAQLQILAPTSPESAVGRFLDRFGAGLQHLAFRVGDLNALSALLRDRGPQLIYPRPGRGTSGSMINFLHPRDTGGVLVELVETDGVHAMAEPGFPAMER